MILSFDYSLSCPCMCVSTAPGWDNAGFYYLTSVKKDVGLSKRYSNVMGHAHKEYSNEQQRYDNISRHFIDIMDKLCVPEKTMVYLENYSFGSKGRVFGLAENTGLMKWKLWNRGYDILSIAPTAIKKFATSHGNATKTDMYNAFFYQTSVDLHTNLTPHKKLGSPVTDIVDAYFIAQYGWKYNESNKR